MIQTFYKLLWTNQSKKNLYASYSKLSAKFIPSIAINNHEIELADNM